MSMFRGRVAVVLASFAMATVCLSMVAAVLLGGDDLSAGSELDSLSRQESDGTETVDFTCDAGTEWAFNVTVRINLDDGMDRDEAVLVANSLFEHVHQHATYELKSTQAHEDGKWTVYLLWGTISAKSEIENHSHYFDVEVNPHNRTLDFNSCL